MILIKSILFITQVVMLKHKTLEYSKMLAGSLHRLILLIFFSLSLQLYHCA